MNRANVWTLADQGDAKRLAKAIQAAPTAVQVAGWSYGGGMRCGIARADDGAGWRVHHGPNANAAPALHYAALGGHRPAAQVLLDYGASCSDLLEGVTAADVAEECGHSALAAYLRLQHKRQSDRPGAMEDDEAAAREAITIEAAAERSDLDQLFGAGTVTFKLTVRASTKAVHNITTARYCSFGRLMEKIEAAAGMRCLVSFTATHDELAKVNRDPIVRLCGGQPLKCLEPGSDSDENAEAAGVSRAVALRPRTAALFLHLPQPECTARPLASTSLLDAKAAVEAMAKDPPPGERPLFAPAITSSHSRRRSGSSLRQRLDEIQASKMTPAERVAALKRIADEEQVALGQRPAPRKLRGGAVESMLARLYTHDSDKRIQRKVEHDRYLEEGHQLLLRSKPVAAELDEHVETIVDRLYTDGIARQSEAIEKAEEEREERVVKPSARDLAPEEIDAASARLYGTARRNRVKCEELERKVYGVPNDQRLGKEAEARLLHNLHAGAIEKKRNALQKISRSVPDFRAQNRKHLTTDQVKSMAERLASRS